MNQPEIKKKDQKEDQKGPHKEKGTDGQEDGQDSSQDIEVDVKKASVFLKKYYPWVILAVILIFGLYVRLYHADYPVVGFHNWKETHYLTEARNFAKNGFFDDGFFVPQWDYYLGSEYAKSGAHGDTFPTTSILVGFFFKLFGPSLFIARLVNSLFVIGAIFFAYAFIKKLFRRQDFALMTAAFMAATPLLVFFGRQTQLINPGLFFGMFGLYYYLHWIEKPTYKNLIAFSVGATLCVITKYPNALIGIPMAAIFPWKRIFDKEQRKKYWKHLISFTAVFSTIVLWALYSSFYSAKLATFNVGKQAKLIKFSVLSTPQFWQIMKSFAADNWTLGGLTFAFIGVVLFMVLNIRRVKRKKSSVAASVDRTTAARFMIAYVIGAGVWFLVMSFKLRGHNYHQYPLAFLFSFMLAYFSVVLASNSAKIARLLVKFLLRIKKKKIIWLQTSIKVLLLLFFFYLFFGHAQTSWNRMFDTQFVGLDVAGEYIKDNSLPDQKMFHSSHQSYGVLWHADRKGHGLNANLTRFKKIEKEDNIQWVFMYQWGMKYLQEKELMDYIKENYGVAQVAFMPGPQGNVPVYMLFKKGGTFNETELGKLVQSSQMQFKDYEYTRGKQRLFYTNII